MLYKYTSWDKNTKENLAHNQLWFNTPDNFNDVFDTLAYYSVINNKAVDKIHKIKRQDIGIFSEENIVNIQRLTEWEGIYHKRYGITCFANNNPVSILLWSHYAEKHTGICLGFEVSMGDEHAFDFMPCLKKEGFSSKLFEMEYISQRQRPTQDDDKLLTKKYDVWSYEKEYRIMVKSRNLNYFPSPIKYKHDKLKKIILGARFKIDGLTELKECLKSYDVDMIDFEVALLDDSEYKICTDELTPIVQETISNHICDSGDDKYKICLSNILPKLKTDFSEDVIKTAWRNAFRHIPVSVCLKFFPLIKKDNFWEKATAKSVNKEDKEIAMFRSYMERQTELELYNDL